MGEDPAEDFEIQAPTISEPKPVAEARESDDHNESMTTLELENSNCIRLLNYIDRLVTLAQSDKKVGRWFPFAYEVIIMMWSAFLQQQQKDRPGGMGTLQAARAADDIDTHLAEAASNAQRGCIACAPLLFEMIKQSLGYRVKIIKQEVQKAREEKTLPSLLAVLDDEMQSRLEDLISMLTDACLNSRNFDSRDLRQMSIDVNDSIVRFLRDMFAYLKPDRAYRLIMVYLARFTIKEGKQGQERDSSIGLRYSWEITKLRLNAMTAVIRFPDFLRVCSPQMNSWGDSWLSHQGDSSYNFFDGVLDRYRGLEISSSETQIPPMRPHWLAEIVTEICLRDIWHAEQYIQQRAASLVSASCNSLVGLVHPTNSFQSCTNSFGIRATKASGTALHRLLQACISRS